MRRVWTNAETVEHQDFQTAQASNRLRWNLAQIGRVGKVVEAICDHRQTSVNYFKRRNFQIVAKTERSAGDDGMRHNLRQAPAKMRLLKDVFEDAADVDPHT